MLRSKWNRVGSAMLAAAAFALILGVAQRAAADEATNGKIKSVDSGRNEIVLKGLVKDQAYDVEKGATIWLDGEKAKLGDLKADDKVTIIFDKTGDRPATRYIRALRNMEEVSGKVSDVISEKREVVLKGTLKNTTYELVKGAVIWVDGKQGSVKDLRTNDEVRITFERRGDHMLANDLVVLKK